MNNLEVWYSHLDIESALAGVRLAVQAEDGQAGREAARQGAHEGQHDGVLEADRTSSTGSARIVDQSPLIVPIDQLAAGEERDADVR